MRSQMGAYFCAMAASSPRANWSGQEVPLPPQLMPFRRAMALHQSGDALEVAVAAAYHLKITDHALIVYLYRHGPGADAPGLECICHIVLPSFLIRLENRITQFFLSAKPGF